MTASLDTSWSAVWTLYRENQQVFMAVFSHLRRGGLAIDEEATQDFIHEFLIERAPSALKTFRPERGELKGWLYVVFKRFVLGSMRDRARRERLLLKFSGEFAVHSADRNDFALEELRTAVSTLTADERRAIDAFLQSPHQSIRDVARALDVSRWRASALMTSAITQLTTKLSTSEADLPSTAAAKPHGIRNQ